jgi:hypothetical protein
VLWPTTRVISSAKSISITHMKVEAVNNLSVALRIDYCGSSMLLLGDLNGRTCARVLDSGCGGTPIRVIKAPHHGGKSSSIPWKSLAEATSPGVILVSCPTARFDYPTPSFLKSVPADKWIIRCTGLAGACTASQTAERWPIGHTPSSLPGSLIRSLLSVGGQYRFPRLYEHEECNVDNVVVLNADGQVTHSSRSRFCDASRKFRRAHSERPR